MLMLGSLGSTDCVCECQCGCLFCGMVLSEEAKMLDVEPLTCPDCDGHEYEVFELHGEEDEWEER